MKGRNVEKAMAGFTLIEIIAVLVILGILAAVAVPKYFALTEQAEARSIDAAAAEFQARVNLQFAQRLTLGDTCAQAIPNLTMANLQDATAGEVGGWTVTGWETPAADDEGDTQDVTFQSKTDNTVSGTRAITLPGCG